MTMSRFAPVAIAIAALSFGAVHHAAAADMPVKAVPIAAPAIYSWAGFYIGAHVGYGWSDLDWTILPATVLDHTGRGYVAGGQIGFNWQWNKLILGVEFDGAASGIKGSVACPNAAFSCSHKIDSLWSLRGRLGTTLGAAQQLLLYATGGAAWAHAKYRAQSVATGLINPGGFENTTNHFGWVAGVGLEYMIAPRWSVKAEYLYYGLGSKTIDCTPLPAVGTTNCSFQPDVQTVKIGVNWHFGPVFAGP